MNSVAAFAQANPDVIVTSDILMEFLATVTKREGAASYESPPRRRTSHSRSSAETDVTRPASSGSDRSSSDGDGARSRTSTGSTSLVYGSGLPETPLSTNKELPPSPTGSPPPSHLPSVSSETNRRSSDVLPNRRLSGSPLSFRQRSSPLEIQTQPARPNYRQVKSRRQSQDISYGSGERSRHTSEEPMSPSVPEEPFTPTPSTRFDRNQHVHLRKISQDDLDVPPSGRPRHSRQRVVSVPNAATLSEGQGRQRQSSSEAQSPDKEDTPPHKLDATSFHTRPLSPTFADEERGPLSLDALGLIRDASNNSSASNSLFTLSRPSSGFLGESFGANASSGAGSLSFRPDSIASINFAGGVSEQDVTSLLRTAQDLGRKLKEQERMYLSRSEDFEGVIAELQGRLEEVRIDCILLFSVTDILFSPQVQNELALKRKDEKELRHKERQHLVQISALEHDVGKLSKSLEKQKDLYQAMRKQYEEQCRSYFLSWRYTIACFFFVTDCNLCRGEREAPRYYTKQGARPACRGRNCSRTCKRSHKGFYCKNSLSCLLYVANECRNSGSGNASSSKVQSLDLKETLMWHARPRKSSMNKSKRTSSSKRLLIGKGRRF
jgi:hypothetical protein